MTSTSAIVVTEEALRSVYNELAIQEVELEGTLLKPNMVLSGKDCPEQAERPGGRRAHGAVPQAHRAGRRAGHRVPVRRSVGRGRDPAPQRHEPAATVVKPWKLSFSYGRALQAAPLKAWGGKAENLEAAQAAFFARAKANGEACQGRYAA